MANFIAIGMRAKVTDPTGWVANTCSDNDTDAAGDDTRWSFCNPTNRAITHVYEDIEAVSLECLWQGTKITRANVTGKPDPEILGGAWRKGKGKRPIGAYGGDGKPLITNPGDARRAIYIPAFRNLVTHWMQDAEVADRIARAQAFDGNIYLRDHDTGQGIDRNGPMSHAWVLSVYFNTGEWPV